MRSLLISLILSLLIISAGLFWSLAKVDFKSYLLVRGYYSSYEYPDGSTGYNLEEDKKPSKWCKSTPTEFPELFGFKKQCVELNNYQILAGVIKQHFAGIPFLLLASLTVPVLMLSNLVTFISVLIFYFSIFRILGYRPEGFTKFFTVIEVAIISILFLRFIWLNILAMIFPDFLRS